MATAQELGLKPGDKAITVSCHITGDVMLGRKMVTSVPLVPDKSWESASYSLHGESEVKYEVTLLEVTDVAIDGIRGTIIASTESFAISGKLTVVNPRFNNFLGDEIERTHRELDSVGVAIYEYLDERGKIGIKVDTPWDKPTRVSQAPFPAIKNSPRLLGQGK